MTLFDTIILKAIFDLRYIRYNLLNSISSYVLLLQIVGMLVVATGQYLVARDVTIIFDALAQGKITE